MKLTANILLLFMALLAFRQTATAQTAFGANTYYQFVKNEQKKIAAEIYEFKKSATDLNLRILKFQINKSIKAVEAEPLFNNETEFRDAALEQFRFFLTVADNEYKDMLTLVEDPDLEYQDFWTKKDALGKKITERSKPYDVRFNKAEDDYAKKYGIKIE